LLHDPVAPLWGGGAPVRHRAGAEDNEQGRQVSEAHRRNSQRSAKARMRRRLRQADRCPLPRHPLHRRSNLHDSGRNQALMARQFIYHMHGMSKAYAGGKKVLDNINLSFYPDAKIGVLGPNGSGKSSLLRIMAGIDGEFTGEAWVAEGATVGYLEQE